MWLANNKKQPCGFMGCNEDHSLALHPPPQRALVNTLWVNRLSGRSLGHDLEVAAEIVLELRLGALVDPRGRRGRPAGHHDRLRQCFRVPRHQPTARRRPSSLALQLGQETPQRGVSVVGRKGA